MANKIFSSAKLVCRTHPDAPLICDLLCTKCGLVVGDRALLDDDPDRRSKTLSKKILTNNCREDPVHSDVNTATPSEAPPEKVACRYHPDSLLIEDDCCGDMICSECGLVVGDRVIDVGTEWAQAPSNGGSARNEHPSCDGVDLERFALEGISAMADNLNWDECIADRATYVFNRVSSKKYSAAARASASLCFAANEDNIPNALDEVCSVSESCHKEEIRRCFSMITRAIAKNRKKHSAAARAMAQSEEGISRMCDGLYLPNTVQQAVIHIVHIAAQINIAPRRSPLSVVAAAIYMASNSSGYRRSKKQISGIVGITVPPITDVYKLLYPHAKGLFPASFEFAKSIEDLPKK